MKILYWNLHENNTIDTLIASCLEENDVDIFLCSEFKNISFDGIIEITKGAYTVLEYGMCDKVKILYRTSLKLDLIREQHRYLMVVINSGKENCLLTGVHLPSNPASNSDDRKCVIRQIVSDIVESEYEVFGNKAHNSIVIGDMNASPFDSEMINKDSFNAVLFKQVIEKQQYITYQQKKRERFYNPIIDYIGETNQSYGSHYYSNGIGSLYWYCYDQVLVRKNLVNNIQYYSYLKKIKGQTLMKNGKPNKKISDHLPLLLTINI